MLHCSACIHNCIRTGFSHICTTPSAVTSSRPHLLLNRRATRYSTWLRRGYAAEASQARDVQDSAPAPALVSHYRTHNVRSTDHPSKQLGPYKKSNVELEVRWLKDPVKLADHTVKLLREDDITKALDIVRLASKDVECTVSWNHLIDYEMSKARVNNAIKLYNEMKKRAQLPDAYTFTIIFRGLSWYPQFSQSTSRALSIYQSMFAENSPVRPTIIHTNAVLKVCALAHDVDALLGIAAELPLRGSGAPNNLTFTIILNAIRSKALGETNLRKPTSRGEDMGRNEATALAVQQGRRLWLEVRQRWMSGDLRLDEEFVCAMGRLLLLGKEAQDQDDVLSLLEQTMGLPRQIARLTHLPLRRAEEALGPDDDPDLPTDPPANIDLEMARSSPNEGGDFPDQLTDPFAPRPNAAGLAQSAVRPGRNTLSLVLDACTRRKYVRAAQNYWGLLTSADGPHRIIPDGDNYHMYLRLLRLQRSSKLTVELVDEMRSGDLTGNAPAVQTKTFRIALSCCVRDMKNRNSVVHAGKLVRMMMDTLPYPDAKALSMYLHVALGQSPRDWRVIMGVIRDTELGVRNLRSLLAYDPYGPEKQNEEDILELVRGLVGAFDVVLDLGNEEITDEDRRRCKEQKYTLSAYITKTHATNQRLVAEGKRPGVAQVEDEGKGGNSTPFKNSRSGRRKGDHHKGVGEGESEREEASHVRPGEGEWTMRGRVQKDDGEMKVGARTKRSQSGWDQDEDRTGRHRLI